MNQRRDNSLTMLLSLGLAPAAVFCLPVRPETSADEHTALYILPITIRPEPFKPEESCLTRLDGLLTRFPNLNL